MKTQAKIPSKKAAGLTAARTTEQQHESYRKPASASTKFRELAANLLIGLQTQTLTVRQYRNGWQLFETVLRQFYDLKTYGGLNNG